MVGKQLPTLSGPKICKILAKDGFYRAGDSGNHFKLKNNSDPVRIVIVPNHGEVARATLNSILKQAKLSRAEFYELMKK